MAVTAIGLELHQQVSKESGIELQKNSMGLSQVRGDRETIGKNFWIGGWVGRNKRIRHTSVNKFT
jgi:hypothetical protein